MSQGDPQNPNNHDNPSRFFSQAHGTSLVQRPVAKSPSSIDSSCQRQSASLRTGKRPWPYSESLAIDAANHRKTPWQIPALACTV